MFQKTGEIYSYLRRESKAVITNVKNLVVGFNDIKNRVDFGRSEGQLCDSEIHEVYEQGYRDLLTGIARLSPSVAAKAVPWVAFMQVNLSNPDMDLGWRSAGFFAVGPAGYGLLAIVLRLGSDPGRDHYAATKQLIRTKISE